MIWKKILMLLICAATAFCFAEDVNHFDNNDLGINSIAADESAKVYVNLNQLLINEHGIYLFYSNEMLPINALFCDQKGFYIIKKQLNGYSASECPNGHPSRHGDGRCNQPSCPYFRG
jgi:hypothetical protein